MKFLREYSEELRYLKGVGPTIASIFKKLGIVTVGDILLYFPRDYSDRRRIDKIRDSLSKDKVNLIVRVIAQDTIGWGRKKTLKVFVEDDTGKASLVCFGRNFLSRVLVPGKKFFVSGSFSYKYGEIQSSNFEIEPLSDEFEGIVPVYPLTEGLTQRLVRRVTKAALSFVDDNISDEIPLYLRDKYNLPRRSLAIREIHFPSSLEILEDARRLFAYEEFFYLQLLLLKRRNRRKSMNRTRSTINFKLKRRLILRLPFELTEDQNRVLKEIERDLFSDRPMSRLLQGDVGCGKTLVAFLAAVSVVEAGEQVALMAPTELLARQHAENAAKLMEPLGIRVALLTGNVGSRERNYLLKSLKEGNVDVVIGTHALFSQDVEYKKLGFVIIDEQHRFGVLQRVSLTSKGKNPDLLLMTATPIPRSLSLTYFGDLDVSVIKTMPRGRKPVITHLAREGNEEKVYNRVRVELNKGHQAYFVYPLIEESEVLSLKDAENMFNILKSEIFLDKRIALIHSRIPEDEKRARMESFVRGDTDILVATSVVEVGVDVPNATCIVIEHAERFGLSALHQLRGRVGRGNDQAYAFLIYSKNLTENGVRRLKVMMETTDGFRIAEEDLKIRGPGEVLGVKQTGFLKFRVADMGRDANLLVSAREDVFTIISSDPALLNPDHLVVREVLKRVPPITDDILAGG